MGIRDLFKSVESRIIAAELKEQETYLDYLKDYNRLAVKYGLEKELPPEKLKEIQQKYHDGVTKTGSISELYDKYAEKHDGKLFDVFNDKRYLSRLEKLEKEIEKQEELSIRAARVIERNVEKFAHKQHDENTNIPESVRSQDQLFRELINNNRGVAFGEVHTQDETTKLMTRNMAAAKKAGVDTIYLEWDDDFEKINSLSVKQLDELAKNGRVKTEEGGMLRLMTAKELARHYGVERADDSQRESIKMLAEAKRHGIRVVNVDARLVGQEHAQNDSGVRVASTNVEWAAEIEKDRKKTDPEGKGKFLVYGGAAHFANGYNLGVVDERLGIPALAFDFSRKETNGFRRASADEGVDFWLDGGPDYHRRREQFKEEREALGKAFDEAGIDPKTLRPQGGQKMRGE